MAQDVPGKTQASVKSEKKKTHTHINIKKILGNIPVTTTTKIFPKVLRYEWEAYCNTNGRRAAIQMGGVLTVFPFPQSAGAPKHYNKNWGVSQYKLEVYCNTFLRSSGGWGFWHSSEIPPKSPQLGSDPKNS